MGLDIGDAKHSTLSPNQIWKKTHLQPQNWENKPTERLNINSTYFTIDFLWKNFIYKTKNTKYFTAL